MSAVRTCITSLPRRSPLPELSSLSQDMAKARSADLLLRARLRAERPRPWAEQSVKGSSPQRVPSSLSQDMARAHRTDLLLRARLRAERPRPWTEPASKLGSSTRSAPRPVFPTSASSRTSAQARSQAAPAAAPSLPPRARPAAAPRVQSPEPETLARARAVKARFEARRERLAADAGRNPQAPAASSQRRNAVPLRPVPQQAAPRPVEKPKPLVKFRTAPPVRGRAVNFRATSPVDFRASSTKSRGRRVHWPESQLLATTMTFPSPPSSSGHLSPTVSREFSSPSSCSRRSADFFPVEPTPLASPPPAEPAVKSSLRKPGSACSVKRVRFDDEHLDREEQVVRKDVHLFKRWIGIVQVRICLFFSPLA
ncbi:MAG: hypothetical protein Q9191_005795 [Dirinaria sp. TL-2023a]